MTEKIYLTDQYMRETKAVVVSRNGGELVLDRTIFYPAGGGQPNDTGTISVSGTAFAVKDLKKVGEDVVHVLEGQANANPGDAVDCRIDWERRYACMRYHTALHTIDGVIERYYGSGMITGGQIYPDRARIDIDMPDLSRERVSEILERTNSIAREGHAISAREIGIDEARTIPRISRTETGRKLLETLKKVRVVEIEGLDIQADGGTHVRNTAELGIIALNSYENKGTRRKRIEIVLK